LRRDRWSAAHFYRGAPSFQLSNSPRTVFNRCEPGFERDALLRLTSPLLLIEHHTASCGFYQPVSWKLVEFFTTLHYPLLRHNRSLDRVVNSSFNVGLMCMLAKSQRIDVRARTLMHYPLFQGFSTFFTSWPTAAFENIPWPTSQNSA